MVKMRIRRFYELEYEAREAVNTLSTNLYYAGGDYKKIMITSCHPGEGKSFVAMNMMRTLAQLDMKVVLVDADIRASSIQKMYGLTMESATNERYHGLTSYLAGKSSIEDLLIQTDIPNAYMVLAGNLVNNSLPLINSKRMEKLLEMLTESFDMVIVDTPPVSGIADAVRIASLCDGTLLVVKSGDVRSYEFLAVMHQLKKTGTPIWGTVLNQYDDLRSRDKYYYGGSYYYETENRRGLGKREKREKI